MLKFVTNAVENYFKCLIKNVVVAFLHFRYKFYMSFFFLIMTVWIKTTSTCIKKKNKSKLCLCVWTRITWPWISESTFSSKISVHNSWKASQLSKMVCNNAPLTVQLFEHNTLPPEFPGALSSLNLLETTSLLREYLIFLFDF